MEMENVIKGLNEIGAFITGRLEYGQAKNFLEFLDEAIAMMKEQNERIKTLEHQLETITTWRANAGAFD